MNQFMKKTTMCVLMFAIAFSSVGVIELDAKVKSSSSVRSYSSTKSMSSSSKSSPKTQSNSSNSKTASTSSTNSTGDKSTTTTSSSSTAKSTTPAKSSTSKTKSGKTTTSYTPTTSTLKSSPSYNHYHNYYSGPGFLETWLWYSILFNVDDSMTQEEIDTMTQENYEVIDVLNVISQSEQYLCSTSDFSGDEQEFESYCELNYN